MIQNRLSKFQTTQFNRKNYQNIKKTYFKGLEKLYRGRVFNAAWWGTFGCPLEEFFAFPASENSPDFWGIRRICQKRPFLALRHLFLEDHSIPVLSEYHIIFSRLSVNNIRKSKRQKQNTSPTPTAQMEPTCMDMAEDIFSDPVQRLDF